MASVKLEMRGPILSVRFTFCLAMILVAGAARAQDQKADEPRARRPVAPTSISNIRRDPTSEEIETLEQERKEDLEIFIRRTSGSPLLLQ